MKSTAIVRGQQLKLEAESGAVRERLRVILLSFKVDLI